MRKRTITLVAIGLSTLALPAFALPPPPDTVLIHGFDDENNVLVFGTSDIDETAGGCDAEGPYDYEIDEDGNASLVDPDAQPIPTTLEAQPVDEADSSDEDPCAIQVVDVTGPNGQVNHGQVVSSFVHVLGEFGLRGHGCVVRYIAQTGYGKGDQQIQTSDVEEPDPDAPALEGGSIDLESVLTACSPSSKSSDEGDDDSPGNSGKDKGRPENPGNSGNHANGNSKDKSNNGRGHGKP